MLIPVILSGGSGSRLWPLSREQYPKQFLPLVSTRTMLQDTITRLEGLPGLADPIVVCNEDHRFMVAEQLQSLGFKDATILLEPVGRNTAPAVALAALEARKRGEDPTLLVLPADHVIRDPSALREAVCHALQGATDNFLMTFGILPHAPETGYGYIKAGETVRTENTDASESHSPGLVMRKVSAFVEKPDRDTAEKYLASEDYYWNSGMFLFRASCYLAELERFAPDILTACQKSLELARPDLDFVRVDVDSFSSCPSGSIDYAIMEKTDSAIVIPLDAGWNDIGSWSALGEVSNPDPDGNVLVGDVLLSDVTNSYLHSTTRLLAAVGVSDLVLVETADAVLVATKDRVQEVKKIVETLKKNGRDEALFHPKVNRPWGNYECIAAAERYQVKRIVVKPGGTLSLQLHQHRAEHWVVVKGTARVTRGDDVLLLTENQSTYIPLGVTHRLENNGKIDLELIEVQSGSYLGEDDIIRLEDKYGR